MASRAQLEKRLREAGWLHQAETQAIFSLLDGEGERTRVVGGMVRDTLPGISRPSADIDFATEQCRAHDLGRPELQFILGLDAIRLKAQNDHIAEQRSLGVDLGGNANGVGCESKARQQCSAGKGQRKTGGDKTTTVG